MIVVFEIQLYCCVWGIFIDFCKYNILVYGLGEIVENVIFIVQVIGFVWKFNRKGLKMLVKQYFCICFDSFNGRFREIYEECGFDDYYLLSIFCMLKVIGDIGDRFGGYLVCDCVIFLFFKSL